MPELARGPAPRTGPRVPLVEWDDVRGEAAEDYEQVRADRGGSMPNLFKALANSPRAMARIGALGTFLRHGTALNPQLREAAILIVARRSGCLYEWTHHLKAAQQLGLEIDPLTGEALGPEGHDQTIWSEALSYVAAVADGVEPEADGTSHLASTIGDQQLIELTVLAAYYVMLARIIPAIRIPAEDGVELVPLPPAGGQATVR